MDAKFVDKMLMCSDCRGIFVFTAGEQLFFCDKQFKNDPKRCKPCKAKRSGSVISSGATPALRRTETRTKCSACNIETTVPFKPTQGRPVLCRECFQAKMQLPLSPPAVVPSPYLVDTRATALTLLSKGQHETGLTPDDAVRAASSMATAHANSSVASAADLASISAPAPITALQPGQVLPGYSNAIEIVPISIAEPVRRDNSAAQELVALDPESVLA